MTRSFRSQLARKGRTYRLAAKLLGWKIDIKSEEEKRQEVQGAIELLSTGAPVSAILIDYGLAEATVDALVKGDIGTVEKLGSMTPELLEALEGIDENDVSLIQWRTQVITGRNMRKKPCRGAQEPTEPEAAEPEASVVKHTAGACASGAGVFCCGGGAGAFCYDE